MDDTALARTAQLGATYDLCQTDTLFDGVAVFTDPDGNHVGLASR